MSSWDSCIVVEKKDDVRKGGIAIDIRCLRAEGDNIRYKVEVSRSESDDNYNALAPYRLKEFDWEKTERGGCLTYTNEKQLLFTLIDHCISTHTTLTEEHH